MMLPLGTLQVFHQDVANQHVTREMHAIGTLHQSRDRPAWEIATDRLAAILGRQGVPSATSRSTRIHEVTCPRTIQQPRALAIHHDAFY